MDHTRYKDVEQKNKTFKHAKEKLTLKEDIAKYKIIYEGRLISNAHSEISRKRDHVFKQTKVGSKMQYFSHKLTYLFFDSRLVTQYFFPDIKQVYACRQ